MSINLEEYKILQKVYKKEMNTSECPECKEPIKYMIRGFQETWIAGYILNIRCPKCFSFFKLSTGEIGTSEMEDFIVKTKSGKVSWKETAENLLKHMNWEI